MELCDKGLNATADELVFQQPQLFACSDGRTAKVILSFSETPKQGSLDQAKAILVDEALKRISIEMNRLMTMPMG